MALAVCLAVAGVAAAFSIYQALKLAMPDYFASGLLAVLFLLLSAGLMTWLHRSHEDKQQDEPLNLGVCDLILSSWFARRRSIFI